MWLLVYTLSAKLNMVHIKCGLNDNTSALQTKTKKEVVGVKVVVYDASLG